MQNCKPTAPWPYPRWIAHRGAGKLAPENTLAAFRLGAQHGYRMFECDVKLSQDDIPFLLHDDTLNRTTNASALWNNHAERQAGDYPWHQLSALDAGSWHSSIYNAEPLANLEQVMRWSLKNACCLNLEIKPCNGVAEKTGTVVAQYAAQLWHNHRSSAIPAPLLSSFQPDALWGALRAEPQLPRALLLDELPHGWLQIALQLQCVAVVLHFSLISADIALHIRQAGLRLLSYTVNSDEVAVELLALSIDGIITDRVDYFVPDNFDAKS